MVVANLINKLRTIVFDINDYNRLVGKIYLFGWRVIHLFAFILKRKIFEFKQPIKYNLDKIVSNKIYSVNPNYIKYILKQDFKITNNTPEILNGRWDKRKILFEKTEIYYAFKQKFENGMNWEEVKYYQEGLIQISKGIKHLKCKDKEEWEQKFKRIDDYYNYLNKSGIIVKPEYFHLKKDENLKFLDILNNISVAIDRYGHFILIEGKEILAIAKILKKTKIPVRIILRHKKWINFKKTMLYFALNYRNRRLYQHLTHPDLQDIPYKYGDTRFNLIKEKLNITKGTLLDIGTNLGYFCNKFEDEGFKCYAVELNPLYIYLLKKLKLAENRRFKIISDSIFNYKKGKELKFDIILALYIFHHFLKRKNAYYRLKKLLNRINVKELYFGAHNPNEFKNKKVYINYNSEQFVQFIINNSCLNQAELIYKADNGRKIYKLTINNNYLNRKRKRKIND